jgi:hypothetical protein
VYALDFNASTDVEIIAPESLVVKKRNEDFRTSLAGVLASIADQVFFAASPEFYSILAILAIRRFVARVRIPQTPVLGIKQRIETGNEHADGNFGGKKIIHTRQYGAGRSDPL